MRRAISGFTLIERMIVAAIISILAAIALPAYSKYRIRSAGIPCMAEAKASANDALVQLYQKRRGPLRAWGHAQAWPAVPLSALP